MHNQPMTIGRQIRTQLGLALAAIFVLLPIMWIVRLAFDGTLKTRPNDAALWPKSWSLANLAAAWRAPRADISFLHLLGNSLIVALSTAAIALVAGTLAAYVFARYRFAGRRFGLFASLVLLTTPPAGLMAPYFLWFNDLGIRRSLLALILVYSAVAVPFALWTVRIAIQNVPRELEEAAMLEGAATRTVFWRVTLPLIVPAVATAGFIGFTLAWSEFALGWVFISDPERVTLAMALYSMRGEATVSWGLLAATTLLMVLPILALFYLLGRYVIQGLSLGAARIDDE
jgi:ABC-type glycerol-3-phosphate transport system permease component